MKFREQIRQSYPELSEVPAGYKRYGDAMVLRFHKVLSPQLGQAILELYPWCQRVFQHETTVGENRRPQLRHLAGDMSTEVLHHENGTTYVLDLAKITFSGGNRYLRERLVEQVSDGEQLLDMFAAVGNLSLQLLVHHRIEARLVERDPYTYQYLVRSLQANQIDPSLAFNQDCRELVLENWADRILMGYHGVDFSHFAVAVRAAKQRSTIHLHPLVPLEKSSAVMEKYKNWVNRSGAVILNHSVSRVKSFAPGIEHLEVILELEKISPS